MRFHALFLLGALRVRALTLAAPPANICGTNKTLGENVLAVLNLTYPGLELVAAAAAAGDLGGACEALSDYYKGSNTSYWLRHGPVAPGSSLAGGVADAIVFNDTFYLAGVGVTARIPRNADGGLDWVNKGPRNDPEFMNCLNRFDSFGELLGAYQKTGNPIYPRCELCAPLQQRAPNKKRAHKHAP